MSTFVFLFIYFFCDSRHSDSKNSSKERSFSAVEEDMSDVYPLQLRLSVMWDSNVLAVKISKKVCSF